MDSADPDADPRTGNDQHPNGIHRDCGGQGVRPAQPAGDSLPGRYRRGHHEQDPSPGTRELREEFTLPKAGLKNELLTLTVTVKDASWHRLGRGNQAQLVRQMDLDSKPPVISVLSGQHNVNHGGTGLVVYSTNEELALSGVRLGDHFFPDIHTSPASISVSSPSRTTPIPRV